MPNTQVKFDLNDRDVVRLNNVLQYLNYSASPEGREYFEFRKHPVTRSAFLRQAAMELVDELEEHFGISPPSVNKKPPPCVKV